MVSTTNAPLTISPAVDRLTRRLAVHLQAGRYAIAQPILAAAAEEMAGQRDARILAVADDTPLASMGLPVRVTNLLESEEIHTVGEVRARSDDRVLEIRNLGPGQLREIRRACR